MGRTISEREKASQRAYYEKNKAAIREYKRLWTAENAERIRARQREWVLQNAERLRARRHATYLAHRDEVLAIQKAYRSDPQVKRKKRDTDRTYQQANREVIKQQKAARYISKRPATVRPKLYERQKAIDQGKDRYFTGRPCKRGHISERFVSSYGCAKCHAERMAVRYRSSPEKYRAIVRKSYQANRDKRLADAVSYRLGNPEKVKAAHKRWQVANPEKIKANTKRNAPRQLARQTSARKSLADSYIRKALLTRAPPFFSAESITPELIEAKRWILKVKRLIKEIP